MEKLEWLQAFAEPEQPETGAAAPTPEQQERLAALSPEGTQTLTQEQREAAMRQGYAMAYGARRAREELTAAMQAGYLRPRESGLTPGAGGAFAESPEHWSRQTREELKTRARRGETIRL